MRPFRIATDSLVMRSRTKLRLRISSPKKKRLTMTRKMPETLSMPELQYIPEPALLFRYDQAVEDPRDGLSLFGPLDKNKPFGIRWGLIGPEASMQRIERWVSNLNVPIVANEPDLARPPFPGFQAVFDIQWPP